MELFGAKTFLFEISIWCETLHLSRKSLVIKIFLKCLNLFAKLEAWGGWQKLQIFSQTLNFATSHKLFTKIKSFNLMTNNSFFASKSSDLAPKCLSTLTTFYYQIITILHQIVDNNDNDFIQNCPNNYDYMVDLAESNPIFRLWTEEFRAS